MEPRATGTRDTAGACDGFDDRKLEAFSFITAGLSWLSSYAVFRWLLPVMRFITPVFRVPFLGWEIVLRYDEVREVLSQDKEFPVSWGEKMVEVTGGPDAGGRNFVLGMPRGDEYRLSYEQIAKAFPLADVTKHVYRLSKHAAERILAAHGGVEQVEFDAVEKLITAVPTELCETYYGIEIPDKVAFARWTLPVSSYLFGPPLGTPATSPPADAELMNSAAACLRRLIRHSIDRAKNGSPQLGVVLPELIRMQRKDPRITDDVIHAQLFGMVLGFIPTNVLAGGNILDTLLLRPPFMERTRAAALAGDDDLLWRCLREALRFRNINLGPWRICSKGYSIAAGRFREVRIPRGAQVLASTQAAMFDPRRIERPHAFDPDRPDEDYLVFGVGQHWCVGAYIAIAQITQTFKPLLKKQALKRVEGRRGCMQRYNVFPLHLHVRYRQRS